MSVSTTGQKGTEEFDDKKAYQPQEEEGVPFVSLLDKLSPRAVN